MAITYNTVPEIASVGNVYRSLRFAALDNSYPAGGYTIDPVDFGLLSIQQCNATSNLGQYTYDFNTATGKLQVFGVSGSSISGSVDLATAGQPSVQMNDIPVVFNPVSLRFYISAVVGGPFQVGETITGGTSAATGVVVQTNTNSVGSFMEYTVTAGTFISGETITGGTSGATATLDTAPIDVFVYPPGGAIVQGAYDFLTTKVYIPIVFAGDLGPSQVRLLRGDGEMEILLSEGVTSLAVVYMDTAGPIMGNHTHGLTFSGFVSAAEITPGTNLTAINNLQIICFGR